MKKAFRVGFFKWKLSKYFELMKFSVISFIIFTSNSAISTNVYTHSGIKSPFFLSLSVFFCQSILFFFIYFCVGWLRFMN